MRRCPARKLLKSKLLARIIPEADSDVNGFVASSVLNVVVVVLMNAGTEVIEIEQGRCQRQTACHGVQKVNSVLFVEQNLLEVRFNDGFGARIIR